MTLAPGITAPDESVTMPTIVPVVCAASDAWRGEEQGGQGGDENVNARNRKKGHE